MILDEYVIISEVEDKLDKLPDSLKADLQKVADDNKVLLMSYIAPEMIRKSPASYGYASIKIRDLYKIEEEIEKLKASKQLPKKLHLIIQTPGGELYTTIKIAKYLQSIFGDQIEAYVPYEAASGGTILCLAAKTITMDNASNLTPIDPQLSYKDETVSANSYEQALDDFKKEYGKISPVEIPPPYQQMGRVFDPIIAKEMDKIARDTLSSSFKLLLKSQIPNPKDPAARRKLFLAAWGLANSDWLHSHVITADEAKDEIGLNIDRSVAKLKLLSLYKKWVSARLKEQTDNHIIECICPK